MQHDTDVGRPAEKKFERRHIAWFPGTSNYPFSPCKYIPQADDEATISPNDQLIMIFDRIGSLSSEDFSFLSEESAIAYADQVYKQRSSMIMQHPKDD